MVWCRDSFRVRFLACSLFGIICAAGCGGESSDDDDEHAGASGEGATAGSSAGTGGASRGGSSATGGTGGRAGAGGTSATGGSMSSGGSAGSNATGGSAGRPSQMLSDLYFFRLAAENAVGEDEEDGAYIELAIANQGEAPAPQPHRLSLVLSKDDEVGNDDDIEVYEQIIDQVIPASDQLETPGLALDGFLGIDEEIEDGFYYVGGIIDADEQVDESNEENNFRLSSRIFVGREDFGVEASGISVPAGPVAAGSEITVAVNIRANGNLPVDSVDFDIVLSEDDELDSEDVEICAGSTDTIELGEEITMETSHCEIPRVRGAYYIGVRLDPEDLLQESNEADNLRFLADPIMIGGPDVDLSVVGFSEGDLELDWQGDLDVTVQIENGGSEAAGTLQLAVYVSEDSEFDENDVQVCLRAFPGVAAGAEADVLVQCHLPPAAAGEMRLLAVVDSADAIFETDESNNVGVAEGTLSIASPDLDLVYALHNVTTAAPLRSGDMFGISLQVQNTGGDAIPGFEVDVYFSTDDTITPDDELACSDRFVDPVPGSTLANVTFSCEVPESLAAGDYYLGVLLDPNQLLPETNEGNNRGVDQNARPVAAE
jgi:hypothetical protein